MSRLLKNEDLENANKRMQSSSTGLVPFDMMLRLKIKAVQSFNNQLSRYIPYLRINFTADLKRLVEYNKYLYHQNISHPDAVLWPYLKTIVTFHLNSSIDCKNKVKLLFLAIYFEKTLPEGPKEKALFIIIDYYFTYYYATNRDDLVDMVRLMTGYDLKALTEIAEEFQVLNTGWFDLKRIPLILTSDLDGFPLKDFIFNLLAEQQLSIEQLLGVLEKAQFIAGKQSCGSRAIPPSYFKCNVFDSARRSQSIGEGMDELVEVKPKAVSAIGIKSASRATSINVL